MQVVNERTVPVRIAISADDGRRWIDDLMDYRILVSRSYRFLSVCTNHHTLIVLGFRPTVIQQLFLALLLYIITNLVRGGIVAY